MRISVQHQSRHASEKEVNSLTHPDRVAFCDIRLVTGVFNFFWCACRHRTKNRAYSTGCIHRRSPHVKAIASEASGLSL